MICRTFRKGMEQGWALLLGRPRCLRIIPSLTLNSLSITKPLTKSNFIDAILATNKPLFLILITSELSILNVLGRSLNKAIALHLIPLLLLPPSMIGGADWTKINILSSLHRAHFHVIKWLTSNARKDLCRGPLTTLRSMDLWRNLAIPIMLVPKLRRNARNRRRTALSTRWLTIACHQRKKTSSRKSSITGLWSSWSQCTETSSSTKKDSTKCTRKPKSSPQGTQSRLLDGMWLMGRTAGLLRTVGEKTGEWMGLRTICFYF